MMITTALIVTCPSCRAMFRMKREELSVAGRPVRCTQCFVSWNLLSDGTNGGLISDDPKGELVMFDQEIIEETPSEKIKSIQAPPLVPNNKVSKFKSETPIKPRKIPTLWLVLGVLAISTIGFFAGRETVLKSYPQSAPIYAAFGLETNLRGLEFREVIGRRVMEEGNDILVIEGKIVNITHQPRQVPNLRLSIRDKKAKEVYHWSTKPSKETLEAGEEISFRARLASPPAVGSDIAVRFITAADLAKP